MPDLMTQEQVDKIARKVKEQKIRETQALTKKYKRKRYSEQALRNLTPEKFRRYLGPKIISLNLCLI